MSERKTCVTLGRAAPEIYFDTHDNAFFSSCDDELSQNLMVRADSKKGPSGPFFR